MTPNVSTPRCDIFILPPVQIIINSITMVLT
nr:MAG TPA: hypothetical protein [Caudoviricetes sp.]